MSGWTLIDWRERSITDHSPEGSTRRRRGRANEGAQHDIVAKTLFAAQSRYGRRGLLQKPVELFTGRRNDRVSMHG